MGSEAGALRVLLVDDQELVRSGLRRILRRKDGFDIVAECADGDQVEAALDAHQPDVVVMDLRMKRVDGIEATRRVRERPGGPPILVLTTFDDDELLSGALRAGAAGFLLKDSPAEELIKAVRGVAARAGELGLGVQGVTASPLPGPSGNVEYFLWLRAGAPELNPADVDRAVAEGPR